MTGAGRRSRPISVREQPGAEVLCPHCRAAITALDATILRPEGGTVFGFGKRYVYACPECHAVLGVSHRKGFWMG